MKKVINVVVAIFTLIIITQPENIIAKQVQIDDIPNNTYVIGTHMFTEDMLLTTSHIMLGASTIKSDKLEDMIIYYKTPRGVWINGLTGDKVTLSSELTIDYKNTKKIEDGILYGDVNQDGVINMEDVVKISKFITGQIELTDDQKKLADIDQDGVIDTADTQILAEYIVDGCKTDPTGYNVSLPYIGHQKYKIETDLAGGKYTGTIPNAYYNTGGNDISLGEPEKEGYVFIGWTGSNGDTPELNVIISTSTAKDLTYTANWVLIGDINQDGTLNGQDIMMIRKYISGKDTLSDIQKKIADADADGVIDSADVQVLTAYQAGGYNIELPYTGHTKYKIEMNLDGGDYSGKIRNAYYDIGDITLDKPTREGYVFIGWTGSNGDTPELNVIISTSTAKDLTYTANWVLIGDINQDGTLNGQDIMMIRKYISGKDTLSDIQKKIADADADGVIDSADVQVLTAYQAGGYNIELPYTGHTKYKIEMNLDGGDYSGKIRNAYYDIGDITLDKPTREGYVFIGWTGSNGDTPDLDVKIPESTAKDLTYTANWALLGDVNQDGTLNGKDVMMIARHVSGKEILSDIQMKIADVDADGVVDSADVQTINAYVIDNCKTDPEGYNIKLPYTGHTKYKIEMNLDGGDYSGIIRNAYYDIYDIMLDNPAKEGYTFIGWTGSNGDTPELTVKIPKGTAKDLTYAANWQKNSN